MVWRICNVNFLIEVRPHYTKAAHSFSDCAGSEVETLPGPQIDSAQLKLILLQLDIPSTHTHM